MWVFCEGGGGGERVCVFVLFLFLVVVVVFCDFVCLLLCFIYVFRYDPLAVPEIICLKYCEVVFLSKIRLNQ